MQQLRRIIVESESTEMSNKAATKKRHHSRNWYIKHKLRQINYKKAIRAAQSLESNEFKLAYEMQRNKVFIMLAISHNSLWLSVFVLN